MIIDVDTRRARLWTVTLSLLLATLAMCAGGCGHADCKDFPHMCPEGTTPGTGGGSAGGAGMGGGAGASLNCDPTGPVNLAQVPECGVCVSSVGSDTMGDGTKDKPYGTFSKALENIEAQRASNPLRKHIYACSFNSMPFVEAVKLSSAVTLHGALDCTSNNNWGHDPDPAKRTPLTAPADAIPLTVDLATGVEILDFSILAAGASAAGGSSIAVLVSDGAMATFTRCDVTAGDALEGTAGDFTGAMAVDADPGGDGKDAGSTAEGGKGAMNTYCERAGGDGGNGGLAPNGSGFGGTIGDLGMEEGGAGGPANSSTPGGPGVDGTAGPDGAGALGSGTIGASGYAGVAGGDGKVGARGTSGGGGGGSKAATVNGAGGGGGGAAGCGGNPGHGGTAGGSSIALMSVNAMVTMNACALSTGKGGKGGKGSYGQKGQNGGTGGHGGKGGNGVGPGADGGHGGRGGDGGNGGGGLGGHALAIAATGTRPLLDTTTCKMGDQGAGGDGGNVTPDQANPGAGGHTAACWDFGMDVSCSADVDCLAQ